MSDERDEEGAGGRVGGKRGPKTRESGLQGAARESRLAQLLYIEVQQKSIRDVSERGIGISRGVIERFFRGDSVGKLELETYDKIAAYLKLPLWKVLELDGIDVELPSQSDQAARLAQLAATNPALAPVLDRLEQLDPEQVRALFVYLEVLERERQSRLGGSGTPPDRSS